MTNKQNEMPDVMYLKVEDHRYPSMMTDAIVHKFPVEGYQAYIRRDIITPEEAKASAEDLQQAEDHWASGTNFVLHATTCKTIRKLLLAHGGGE